MRAIHSPIELRFYRAFGRVFPASFVCVECNQNPCFCGHFMDPVHECVCRPADIERYHRKISGPISDRIDLQVYVPRVKYEDLRTTEAEETSAQIRERVCAARTIQLKRLKRYGVFCNAAMNHRQVERFCKLDASCNTLMENAFCKLGLSARSYDRILKVARTIADLAGSDEIQPTHIAEAIQLRTQVNQ